VQSIAKKLTFLLMVVMLTVLISACNTSEYEQTESRLISANNLSEFIASNNNLVIVDMQNPEDYATGHVDGSVNITKNDILINVPVDNMLTSKVKFERLMGEKGIDNESTVLIYDNDRLSAATLWWTLLVYGNENAFVLDGGLQALNNSGIEMTSKIPNIKTAVYTAQEKNNAYLAKMSDVKAQLDEPNENVILLDVRTDQEYAEKGKIPSSIMMDYAKMFYSDNTFKDVQATRINFMDNGMRPEKEIIIYCQTSIRASSVFLSLYNAGYRNIKIYDGAFLEWCTNPNNPIELPNGAGPLPSNKDAS
jgi:thiosulfate/3-mercaptopyruvate sulfurtransferase